MAIAFLLARSQPVRIFKVTGTASGPIDNNYPVEIVKYIGIALTISTGLLMVSNFRYSSFKEIDLKGKVPFFVAIAVMLSIAFVMAQPETMLFLLFLGYAISGPVITLVMRKRRLHSRKV